MSNEAVKIYFDKKRQVFYIEKISGAKELLPESFFDFRKPHKEILASVYPSLKEDIMSAEIGDSVIETAIEPKIAEYNADVRRSRVTRWFKVSGNGATQIKSSKVPDECVFVSEYCEDLSLESVLGHIQTIKQDLLHRCYVVFECPSCHKKQFQVAKNNRVRCGGCGESFNINDDNVCVKKKCDSEDSEQNKSNAIACWIKWKKEAQLDADEEESYNKENYPFYLNGTVYRVSYMDCLSLHHKLYQSFAYESVFTQTETGIKFKDRYKRYLRSLKDYGIETELFKNLKGAENRINSQEYALLPITKAYYWYIKNYCLKDETTLVWRISNETVCYKNRRQFIDDLLTADEERRIQLLAMYRNVASLDLENGFFVGYGDALIELSYMIYEETGLFVYIMENKFVNFGQGFIGSLHEFDGLISDRNAFLESIKIDAIDFWDRIKGAYDDEDNYEGSVDGTYYDRLCFYQYVMQGKNTIRYKGIVLHDSKDGFEYIKRIIVEAYLSGGERNIQSYKELSELLKNPLLWENDRWFSLLKEAKSSRISDEGVEDVLSFDSLREMVVQESNAGPSVKLYLACVDTSSKSIKKIRFWYKKELVTLAEHIGRITEYGDSKNISNEVHQFYSNADVLKVIECTFNQIHGGGFEDFKKQTQKQFDDLTNGIKREEGRLEELRRKVAAAEIRGESHSALNRDKSPFCGRGKPAMKNAESSAPANKPKNKKEGEDDEWA